MTRGIRTGWQRAGLFACRWVNGHICLGCQGWFPGVVPDVFRSLVACIRGQAGVRRLRSVCARRGSAEIVNPMSENTFDGALSGQTTTILRFGVFELDPRTEQLRRNGLTVRLQPQPFKLLRLLVGEAGRLVTRDEIRAALWNNDTFVDFEQGVNFAIRQVREALEDDAERPVYIQTVPKRGYRFLAPVETVPREGPTRCRNLGQTH